MIHGWLISWCFIDGWLIDGHLKVNGRFDGDASCLVNGKLIINQFMVMSNGCLTDGYFNGSLIWFVMACDGWRMVNGWLMAGQYWLMMMVNDTDHGQWLLIMVGIAWFIGLVIGKIKMLSITLILYVTRSFLSYYNWINWSTIPIPWS